MADDIKIGATGKNALELQYIIAMGGRGRDLQYGTNGDSPDLKYFDSSAGGSTITGLVNLVRDLGLDNADYLVKSETGAIIGLKEGGLDQLRTHVFNHFGKDGIRQNVNEFIDIIPDNNKTPKNKIIDGLANRLEKLGITTTTEGLAAEQVADFPSETPENTATFKKNLVDGFVTREALTEAVTSIYDKARKSNPNDPRLADPKILASNIQMEVDTILREYGKEGKGQKLSENDLMGLINDRTGKVTTIQDALFQRGGRMAQLEETNKRNALANEIDTKEPKGKISKQEVEEYLVKNNIGTDSDRKKVIDEIFDDSRVTILKGDGITLAGRYFTTKDFTTMVEGTAHLESGQYADKAAFEKTYGAALRKVIDREKVPTPAADPFDAIEGDMAAAAMRKENGLIVDEFRHLAKGDTLSQGELEKFFKENGQKDMSKRFAQLIAVAADLKVGSDLKVQDFQTALRNPNLPYDDNTPSGKALNDEIISVVNLLRKDAGLTPLLDPAMEQALARTGKVTSLAINAPIMTNDAAAQTNLPLAKTSDGMVKG